MQFEPNIVEQLAKLVAEQITGSKITNMLENLNLRTDEDSENNTKWKRLYNAAVNAHNYGDDSAIISIIEYTMNPINFIKVGSAEYKNLLNNMNTILLMRGLELTEAGKITTATKAKTLSEAEQRSTGLKAALKPYNIHPQILMFCRPEILTDNYFHLVLEATKCVLTELRIISKLSLDGIQLINACFDGKNPLIVFNKLETNQDKDEHKGLQSLLTLIVHWYRNPQAHTSKYLSYNTKEETIVALIIISKARILLEKCFINPTHQ